MPWDPAWFCPHSWQAQSLNRCTLSPPPCLWSVSTLSLALQVPDYFLATCLNQSPTQQNVSENCLRLCLETSSSTNAREGSTCVKVYFPLRKDVGLASPTGMSGAQCLNRFQFAVSRLFVVDPMTTPMGHGRFFKVLAGCCIWCRGRATQQGCIA